ncbi:uncharacterized protein LOC111643284 [Copidosoma floridanum]|uniref:uncharacterized protein LOC111643284 n=1 Tax=Copidosoma floridanum TaxID=29053 RepID=UPI000C6F93C6|nr:uncharacterized protein LOC111643284 [Copidosoma floridanum]
MDLQINIDIVKISRPKLMFNGSSVCVDSVARCGMLNMKQFNGLYGCTYCEHPTEAVNGVRKYPIQHSPPPERSDSSIKNQMVMAYESNAKDIKGVKGPSSLMNLRYFDLVNGMILDYLHCCLLGVAQLYTNIIFSNATESYYVGSPDKIAIIDKRLLSMKSPSCVAKIARSVKEKNMWKASEWFAWIIFYAPLCLRKIFKKKYYSNLVMFSTAMEILLQDSVSSEMIETAQKLLIIFCVEFENLYGRNYAHYNVHLLLHLCKTVKNWGPTQNCGMTEPTVLFYGSGFVDIASDITMDDESQNISFNQLDTNILITIAPHKNTESQPDQQTDLEQNSLFEKVSSIVC